MKEIINSVLTEMQETLSDGERFTNSLILFNKGNITPDEFSEICNDIFSESKSVLKSTQSYLVRIVEHILLMIYGNDKNAHNHITREIKLTRNRICRQIEYQVK